MLKGANQRKSQPVPAAWSSVLMAVKIIEEEKEKKFGGGGISCLNWTQSSWQGEVVFLTLAKPDYFFKGMKKKAM